MTTAPRSPARRRRVWVVVSAALLLTAAGVLTAGLISGRGCAGGPKAPPLTNDSVYQNGELGLRFLVPDGWLNTARADVPTDKLPKPLMVAVYFQPQGDPPAALELLAIEAPDGTDLIQYLAENPVGHLNWRAATKPQPASVNGVSATKFTLTAGSPKGEVRREVTAFRRGERVYLFMVTHPLAASAGRDAARRSVESVTWSN